MREEKEVNRRFPEAFDEYKARVPSFLPHLFKRPEEAVS